MNWRIICKSITTAVFVALLLAIAAAIGITTGFLNEESIGLLAVICTFFAMLISILYTVKQLGKQNLSGIIVAAAYLILCICANIIVFDGRFKGMWLQLLAAAAGTALVYLIPNKKNNYSRQKWK